MHHSPVAILQNKRHGREYRASSLSHQQQLQLGQGLGQLGTSAGTPSSLSSSYIDHAFDHPTPTSFSQLQFLSSSVASNEGSDYTHRVPRVEEKFCSGFHCCGLELDDLHHLLEHFEECHVLSGPPDPNNLPVPMPGVSSAFESHSSSQDGPQFDDFDEEEAERQRRENPNGASSQSQQQPQIVGATNVSGTGPTLSAPPSPALSSYSDNFPNGHNANNGSTSAAHPLYELKTKRRSNLNSSQTSFPSFRSGKSRSPPMGGDDESANAAAAGGVSEDENSGHLPFTRRARQQSVDSVASVSTNASTSSKKRSFGAAMGSTRPNLGGASSTSGTANNSQVNLSALAGVNPSALSTTRGRPGIGGIDLTNIRGPMRSAISTPDSSVPGTPASDYMGASTSEMIDSGCLPPSLLFPHAPTRQFDDNDMATDDDDDEDGNGDAASNASFYTGYEFDDSQDEDAQGETEDLDDLQSSFGGHEHKRSRTSSSSASASQRMRNPRRNGSGHVRYDSQTDQQAAAMFSPLSLLTGQNTTQSVYQQQYNNNSNNTSNNGGSNILVPTVANSTSPNSQATASAATLAAIQAAAAANGINTGSTPTGRIWIPNNAKPFKCPVPGCDKAYKQQNGLKYHRLHGHCNSNGNGKEGEGEVVLNEEDKPFGCYVGPACGKKYKNMNGLRYHYQHSGAHGQIGLQMLSNGTHPPPAYPPGHKRSSNSKANLYSEYSNTASPTVVMNQSTAEALLAAISTTNPPHQNHPHAASSGHSSRNSSRPATPRLGTPNGSRGPSPTRQRTSPQRQASMASFPSLPMGMGVAMDDY